MGAIRSERGEPFLASVSGVFRIKQAHQQTNVPPAASEHRTNLERYVRLDTRPRVRLPWCCRGVLSWKREDKGGRQRKRGGLLKTKRKRLAKKIGAQKKETAPPWFTEKWDIRGVHPVLHSRGHFSIWPNLAARLSLNRSRSARTHVGDSVNET